MSATVIDELVTLLGFKMDPKAQQTVAKFNEGIAQVGKYAMAASAALMAAAGSLAYFAERATHSAAEMEKFVELTGMSAKSLQQWRYAVEATGGSADSAMGDIEGLIKALNPVMPGEYNSGLFMLGMYDKKYHDVGESLLALSAKLSKMRPEEALNWAGQIGVSKDMLMLLRQGPAEVQKLLGETPALMSPEQLKKAYEMEKQLAKVKYTIKALGETIVTGVLPPILKLMEKFDRWLKQNKELVQSRIDKFIRVVADGVQGFAENASKLFSTLKGGLPFASKFFDLLLNPKFLSGAVQAALWGITISLGLMASEWLIIGGAVAAVVLGIEDLIALTQGKDSVFGRSLGWLGRLLDPSYQTEGEKNGSDSLHWYSGWGDTARAMKKHWGSKLDYANGVWDEKSTYGEKSILKGFIDDIRNVNMPVVNPGAAAPQVNQTNINNTFELPAGTTDPYSYGNEVDYRLKGIQFGAVAPGQ